MPRRSETTDIPKTMFAGYLTYTDYFRLKKESDKESRPISEVVRDLMVKYLEHENNFEDPLLYNTSGKSNS